MIPVKQQNGNDVRKLNMLQKKAQNLDTQKGQVQSLVL